MKGAITLAAALLICTAAHAQTAKNKAGGRSGNPGKKVVYGYIKDTRSHGVKASVFVYKPDSSIIASGETDSYGYFETNGLAPGPYFAKVIYPNRNTLLVYNFAITLKNDLELNLRQAAPEADTMASYESVMPKKIAMKKQ